MVKVYPIKIKEVEVNSLHIAYLMAELELVIKPCVDPFLVSDQEYVEDAIQRVLQVEQVIGKIKLAIKQ